MSIPDPPGRRAEVLAALGAAGREQSTAVVLFHTNLAARLGLGPTEVKVLELVARHGPLSPKELRARTGLAAASITGVLDRLETRRFVERRRSPHDGRSVEVVHSARHTEVVGELFTGLVDGLGALHAGYRTDELETILDYVRRATAMQLQAALELVEPEADGSGDGSASPASRER